MAHLTLLLPPLRKFAGLALPPELGKALGRAERRRGAEGEDAQLLRYFQLLPNRPSQAALSRVLETGEAEARGAQWLRADPAHIRPDINGARLLGIGRTVGIDATDVDALLPALRPLFGDLGMILDAPHPDRWYLRLAAGASLPNFAPPDMAVGDDVFEHIPDAPEARRWRALLNETQIVLHNHPHNAARLASGRVPINSLWFWGGGNLPDTVACSASLLYSEDPALCGAATLAGLPIQPVTTWAETQPDAVVDLRSQRDLRGLLSHWLQPACAQGVILDFADGYIFEVRPSQRWCFWRKPLSKLSA